MATEMKDRERTVLRYVVHDFIETATPVGSRYMCKRHEDEIGLSPASIRNVMSDLEGWGYISHPHTSAGRVPTDRGYRFYLDSLMELEQLTHRIQDSIRRDLAAAEDREEMLKDASKLLGMISHQLCIVSSPQLSSGTFEKLEIVPLVGSQVMVIISVKSGLVRTIMMELASEVTRDRLEDLGRFLNERLHGLTLNQIRESFAERVKEAPEGASGLVRLFIDSVDKIFVPERAEKLHIAGTDKIIEQPDFIHPRDLRSIIELISDEEMIIHVLRKNETGPKEIKVSIGEENESEKLKPYSVITSSYTVGDVKGTIGVLGPTRMPYDRMIPLVDYVARTISALFTNTNRA
jgi:heat-inducible transcriptional repressor